MSAPSGTSNLEKTRVAWGGVLPDWVEALARACDESSQVEVGHRLRYSTAVVNQVLKNTYGAGLTAIETRVRGAFLSETVPCPEVGELTRDLCTHNQTRPFANTNPTRVQLYRACRSGCVHSKHTKVKR